MRNSDQEWEKLARLEPYYSILIDPELCVKNVSQGALKDFFVSGALHVDSVFSTIHRHFNLHLVPKRALDFGCGVGRILVPLSQKCEALIGVDVSDSMLAEARKNCTMRGIENVELIRADDDLSNLVGEFDFIHSFIVFQHIRVSRGEHLLTRTLSMLSPNGIAAIQFVLSDRRSFLRKIMSWTQKSIPLVHNAANLFKGRPWGFPHVEMNNYDLNRVLTLSYEQGCAQDDMTIQLTCYEGAIGAFIFMRKSTNGRSKSAGSGKRWIDS